MSHGQSFLNIIVFLLYAFMFESYFRNGQKVNGMWEYSLQVTWDGLREEFHNTFVDWAHFYNALQWYVTKFLETSFLQRKEGPKDKTPEKIENDVKLSFKILLHRYTKYTHCMF